MSTDEPQSPPPKPSRSGFAVSITLNVLVIVSVLVLIPVIKHDHEVNPLFLTAFFNQMEVVGVIAFCLAVGDLLINLRREDRRGAILATAGILLALTPQPLGSFALHVAAHFLGWRLDG